MQLYGAMASWGEIAVGEQRGTARNPTRTAVLGLVAAALGLRREQEEDLQALHQGYGLGLAVLSPGVPVRDYHTAQAPQVAASSAHQPGPRATTMKVAQNIHTILSQRDYLCDAFYKVALWPRQGAPYTLEDLARAARAGLRPLAGAQVLPAGAAAGPQAGPGHQPGTGLPVHQLRGQGPRAPRPE
jgi:CRISPR system Cascade subunit CasD